MSDMTRKEVIDWLCRLRSWIVIYIPRNKQECKQALDVAIASLEADEAYQLEYEQPEFCANCIDRKALLAELDKRMKNFKGFVGSCNGIISGIYQFVQGMPSVLPKADKPTIIDWNNCHTPEQLDSIATTKNDLAVEKTDMIDKSNFSQEQYKTDLQSAYDSGYEKAKNDLGVDCISRQAVIDELKRYFHDEYYQRTSIQDCRDCFIEDVLNHLPSVTPQEPKSGHWIMTSDYLTTAYGSIDYVKCSCCGEDSLEEGDYCPNCGCRMVEPQESDDKE